jgi:AcrR family transcriptional regulator
MVLMTDRSDSAAAGHDPRKHERLLEAAAAEFARVGFDRANLDTITRSASVAKGTVYLYFASKTALFVAVLQELQRRLEMTLAESKSIGQDPADPLRFFIRAHLALADAAPDLFRCYTSALFGVNRDFQSAALSIFTWQTRMLRDLLAPPASGKQPPETKERAALLAASILAAALVRGLAGREGRSTALTERALLAMAPIS